MMHSRNLGFPRPAWAAASVSFSLFSDRSFHHVKEEKSGLPRIVEHRISSFFPPSRFPQNFGGVRSARALKYARWEFSA